MQPLFVVLGIIFGLIAGFAITYFTFVGKLQKKLANAKKKLDRAQSANEETETLQSQLEAQRTDRQAAEAQLASLETAHQTRISELEAELESLRQSSGAVAQLPPDYSEAVAALQSRLAEVEQQHQETLQSRLAEVEQQHQETLQSRLAEVEQQQQADLQALEARHQDELESLRQSLTVAAPPPAMETATQPPESFTTEPADQGNWGAAAIAGGAAAIGAGVAALGGLGQFLSRETEEQDLPPEDLIPEPEPGAEFELPAEAEWTAAAEATSATEVPGLAVPELPEFTGDLLPTPEAEPFPFDQSAPFGQAAVAEAPVADLEDLSPFASPEALVDGDNWVDAPEEGFSSEAAVDDDLDNLDQQESWPDFGIESPSPLETAAELDVDTANWVDGPAILEQEDNEFTFGEILEAVDLLPDFPETSEAGLLDVDDSLPEVDETADLPYMGEAELALELPDMTEEPAPGEFSFGDQTLEALGDDLPDGDELLAELTGGGERTDADLDLFTLDATSAEAQALEDELFLPSNPGDTLEMPDSFLADIPSFIPDPDTDAEDISELGTGSEDDLDFLLQLQEDEPLSSPGEEFLPEFNDEDPLGSDFSTMELLVDDNSELSELLGDGRSSYEGDPFINILDEPPPASDRDLLALLQDEEGSSPHHHESDDDLFSGLEGMLNTDTPDDQSDLDDLDALLSTAGEPGTDQGDVFSLEDLGLGEEKY